MGGGVKTQERMSKFGSGDGSVMVKGDLSGVSHPGVGRVSLGRRDGNRPIVRRSDILKVR